MDRFLGERAGGKTPMLRGLVETTLQLAGAALRRLPVRLRLLRLRYSLCEL